MDQIEQLLLQEFGGKKKIDVKEAVLKYIVKWHWFVISILLFLAIAAVKIRYTPNLYKVQTTILIKENKKGGIPSEFSAFEDLGAMLGGGRNVDNEVQVLKSRHILKSVVKRLKLNIRYLSKGRMREAELYGKQQPFTYVCLEEVVNCSAQNKELIIRVLSDSEFELLNEEKEVVQKGVFGTLLTGTLGNFILHANKLTGKKVPKVITVVVNSEISVVNALQGRVHVGIVHKKTSVVALSLVGEHKQKSTAILDQLVAQYNLDAIEDKNQISENTANFIKNRLLIISEELNAVDVDVADFKEKNKLTDIASESSLYITGVSESEKELLEASTQMKLVDYMLNYLHEINEKEGLVPVNLGFKNEAISFLSNTYNTLILKRNQLLKTSSEINPMVIDLNDNIAQIKTNLTQSLQNSKSSVSFKLNSLKRRNTQLKSHIANVPQQELVYRDIQRQLQIKEALYLYLLQKREETAISLAVTVSNAKIIDEAYGSIVPISPKKTQVVMIAFLIGLLIPGLVIYVQNYLNTKIQNKSDLEDINAPYIGDIPLLEKGKEKSVVNTGTDSVSEAFRILRRSVIFNVKNGDNIGNILMIGSSISGEGKTLVALNLATSLALSGKKVLLLELDLRNPSFRKEFKINSNKGFVNYIISPNQSWKELCIKNVIAPDLDVLLSGDIPPNPSELLMHSKVATFFSEVKASYDYIVVDTAPVGLVADTLEISKFADLFIYVIRIHYSEKNFVSFIQDLETEGKIKNLGLLLNAVSVKKGYGFGYGYGYGHYYLHQEKKQKKWYSI